MKMKSPSSIFHLPSGQFTDTFLYDFAYRFIWEIIFNKNIYKFRE